MVQVWPSISDRTGGVTDVGVISNGFDIQICEVRFELVGELICYQ